MACRLLVGASCTTCFFLLPRKKQLTESRPRSIADLQFKKKVKMKNVLCFLSCPALGIIVGIAFKVVRESVSVTGVEVGDFEARHAGGRPYGHD